jgi:hypothetical protein
MTRIEQCLAVEARERAAAERASNEIARDLHVMLAERYADEAWSLNEADDNLAHSVSGLWKSRQEGMNSSQAG